MSKEDDDNQVSDEQIIQEWVDVVIQPILKDHPELNAADLIIEGGVGSGSTMADIIKVAFPNARYIGMDVIPGFGNELITTRLPDDLFQDILSNGTETSEIRADCFDLELVRDIAQKTGSKFPVLVSFNALYALLHGQNCRHRPESGQITGEDSPYTAQIHLTHQFLDLTIPEKEITSIEEPFLTIGKSATHSHYRVSQYDHGIVVVKSPKSLTNLV
jgi:hypothetical protein